MPDKEELEERITRLIDNENIDDDGPTCYNEEKKEISQNDHKKL